MPLTPGTRLGAYEVTAPIGEGGMGQVYRATDTKLKRQVAIKILSPLVTPDADHLARFQREAEMLAALNHPNIAAIYGVEETAPATSSEQSALFALVMEFVQGEDLSHRIAAGVVPMDEALSIARQIAAALEAAHEQGIVHRDLKPANIKVRDDGTVKVLDFGLAKMLDPGAAAPSSSLSPTITTPGVTGRGVVLGTAAYMSPEQARGKLADKRSDIWAFGCVLFEMLTGTRAFGGEEITDILASIVRDEPDWSRLPADTPAAIRRVLRRSLKKDRKQRVADMADVRLDLDDAHGEAPAPEPVAAKDSPRVWRERVWVTLAVASLLATALIGIRAMRAPQPDARVVRFDIAPPTGSNFDWGQPVSPDGRTIAFSARSEGKVLIWVRPVDSTSVRSLPGTEGATRLFWSPDSQHVAFLADGNLKAAGIDGSAPRLIARGPFREGAWGANGLMLVGGQLGRPIMRVSERGGEPVAETTLDTSVNDVSHDYPEFLPDGRHYIYLARRGVRNDEFAAFVGTLGSAERRPLPGIRSAMKYSRNGHILFLRGVTLMAQAFSLERLELSGEPFPVAEQVAGNRTCTFSVSDNGTLAFIGGTALSELTWFDRTGRQLSTPGPAGAYGSAALSPDGRYVAFDRGADLWTLDLEQARLMKVTSDPSVDTMPVWSPSGRTITFVSNRGGAVGLYERALGGAGDDRLLTKSDMPMLLGDWSRDGRHLTYAVGGDIWALPVDGERKPFQVTTTPLFQESAAAFSPDGRWLAYQSDESKGVTRSGEGDVFVQSFPQRDFKQQVTTAGGFGPRWSDDGKELYFAAPDGMLMAVAVMVRGSALELGAPKPLFRTRLSQLNTAQPRYGISKDGRFLMRIAATDLSITVIVNWTEELKRLVPTR